MMNVLFDVTKIWPDNSDNITIENLKDHLADGGTVSLKITIISPDITGNVTIAKLNDQLDDEGTVSFLL
jgi:hypothetical protein